MVRSRELLFDLAWKELRVRYRYAFMGFLWAIIEPVALMLILTFVFTLVFAGKTAALRGETPAPFAVVLLCGLIPWQFLANSLTTGTRSLIDHQELVKKVYFPREVVPLSAVGTCLVNFVIGLAILAIVHLIMGGSIGLGVCWFPVVFLIQLVMVCGLVLLCSCLNVFFRDIGYMVSVGIVFGFYATPIFYTLEDVLRLGGAHPWLVRFYMLNPMAELNTAYRQVLFESRFPDPHLLVWPIIFSMLILAIGVVVFRRNSAFLSDHL